MMACAHADSSLNLTGDLPTYLRDTSVVDLPLHSPADKEHDCNKRFIKTRKEAEFLDLYMSDMWSTMRYLQYDEDNIIVFQC